jgi:hypothetical protein
MRDEVSQDMRSRLLTNRHGRLTSDQWKDMVTEPLAVLLLLMVPIVLILGPRLTVIVARGWLILLAVGLLVVVIPTLLRARRYSRAPIYFERLYAGDNPVSILLFWRPQILFTEDGEERRFRRRLAPPMRLRPNRAYLVYYLQDNQQPVLLSMAPADHPAIDQWQPSAAFHERFARRAGG